MTVLTRWEPYRELSALQNRLGRLFDEQYGGREEALTTGAFVPAVDIYEDEHSIQLKLEVPGVDEKDLDIKVENNTLTVNGERKLEKEEKEENFHRVERRYGSFTRSFTLPSTVSTDDIQADYEHGVLKVRLAKRAEAKPKQIKVSVGGQKPIEGKKVEGQAQSKTQAA
ncbi:MAG: Hsp20/alpha crystallin family protein [Candidatus Korobacteraceae bacterium]